MATFIRYQFRLPGAGGPSDQGTAEVTGGWSGAGAERPDRDVRSIYARLFQTIGGSDSAGLQPERPKSSVPPRSSKAALVSAALSAARPRLKAAIFRRCSATHLNSCAINCRSLADMHAAARRVPPPGSGGTGKSSSGGARARWAVDRFPVSQEVGCVFERHRRSLAVQGGWASFRPWGTAEPPVRRANSSTASSTTPTRRRCSSGTTLPTAARSH